MDRLEAIWHEKLKIDTRSHASRDRFFAEQASFLENAPISHQFKVGGLLITPPKLEVFRKKNPR